MKQILVYGDSMSWGLIPGTRKRLAFEHRWPGVMEIALNAQGRNVRVIEDCLNGRRTAWDDPFKSGRKGLDGLGQRIEVNSPLDLVILMLGTNDFQAAHANNAFLSAQGIAALITAIRAAPIEPGMPVPPILVVTPPPVGEPRGPNAPKFVETAVRSQSLNAAYKQVCELMGCRFFDAGEVDGQTSAEREEVRALKAEVRRLREDNAILKAAATFFAGELDPRKRS